MSRATGSKMPFFVEVRSRPISMISNVYERSALSNVANSQENTEAASESNELLPPPLSGTGLVDSELPAPATVTTETGDCITGMEPQLASNALKPTAPTKHQPSRPRVQHFQPYGGYTPSEPTVEHKSVSKPTTNADMVYNPYHPGAPGPKTLTAVTETTGKRHPTYSNATLICDNGNHQHVEPTRLTCIDVNANLGYPDTTYARRKIQEFLNKPSLPVQDNSGTAGWEVVVPGVPGCNNKCQTSWGWCTLHSTCSCPQARYAQMHKWAPIDKPKKEGGRGWRKGIKAQDTSM